MGWLAIALLIIGVITYFAARALAISDHVGCTTDDMDPAWCFDCEVKGCARRGKG